MAESPKQTTASPGSGFVEVVMPLEQVNTISLPNDTSQKFLAAFANSLASNVTSSLIEQLAASRAEAEVAKMAAVAAAAAVAATEEEADTEAPAEKEEKLVEPEDMIESMQRLDLVYDKSTGERNFEAWDPLRAASTSWDEGVPDKYAKWALILQRVFDWNGGLEGTTLHIQSLLIRKVVKKTVPPEAAAMEGDDVSVRWPCDNFFRFRDFIREGAVEEGKVAVKHCDALMQLIEKEYGSKIRDIKAMFPKGISTFEILREAYWPGEFLVEASLTRIYRITSACYQSNACGMFLEVSCDYIDYNGTEFGTAGASFSIREFHGVKYINQLSAFPLKYHPDQESIKATLVERGKEFTALKGQCYRNHNGIALTLRFSNRTTVESRVMIDTATYNRIHPDLAISVTGIKSELVDGELTDEHLMMCTTVIPIFSFQDKRHYKTDISQISEIVFNEKVFDQLVLPEAHKDLVRVLVENHSKGAAFDDFVAGKGKGLILVLHGPPGVGKTMTAEAVAEHTKRPLYIVTSGELGSCPSSMENELERVLDLAKTFKAVLLLDEADVFLEQRTCQDLSRNALVSIFLRQLEYYQGILFLTTNRIGTFDEAFHSRIHISLYYQNLSAAGREQVWRNFAVTMDTDLAGDDFAQLARTEINGRQVKNVFRTAQALAADKGEKIGMRHVSTVLQVMKGFDIAKQRGGGVER